MKREDFPNRATFSPTLVELQSQARWENLQRQVFQPALAMAKLLGHQPLARQLSCWEKKAKLFDRVKLLVLEIVKRAIANRDAFNRAFAKRIIRTIQKQVNKIITNRLDDLPAKGYLLLASLPLIDPS